MSVKMTAVLCVGSGCKDFKKISLAIMKLTEACYRKGVVPLGCIESRGGKYLFNTLNEMREHKVQFDYFLIWSTEQIGITKMEEFVLDDKIKNEFGAKLIVLHGNPPPLKRPPKS